MNIKDSFLKIADMTIFECKWVGDYRLPIMGLAIISVMYCHSTIWAQLDKASVVWRLPDMFFGLIFTGTFLLLSGYGIYFSLSKGGSIASFYKRRLFRVFLPFVLLSFPFYLYYFIARDGSFSDFILNITSLYNVVKGNNGMWYITASFLMYALSPFIYRMAVKYRYTFAILLLVTFLFVLLSVFIHFLFPVYYVQTYNLWNKLWIYTVGMILAYVAIHRIRGGGYFLQILIGLFILACLTRDRYEMGSSFYQLLKEAVATILMCIILHMTVRFKTIQTMVDFLSWFGRYSLELYILHMLIYHFLIDLHISYVYFEHVHPSALSFSSILISIIISKPAHTFVLKINEIVERKITNYKYI